MPGHFRGQSTPTRGPNRIVVLRFSCGDPESKHRSENQKKSKNGFIRLLAATTESIRCQPRSTAAAGWRRTVRRTRCCWTSAGPSTKRSRRSPPASTSSYLTWTARNRPRECTKQSFWDLIACLFRDMFAHSPTLPRRRKESDPRRGREP